MFLERIARKQAAITESSELAKLILAGGTNSGMSVNAESAMRVSAVYACVRVLSESVAQLPFIYYQREGNKKQRASSRRLYTLLHDAPNDFQTSFGWRETKTAHLCLRGNAYSFINRSITGDILELLPMHPDRVDVKQNKDYSLSYTFLDQDNVVIPLRQDQVFRLTGMSLDGVNGLNPIAYQRETLGIALAADKHTALSFKNGSKMTGILKREGHFKDKDVAKRVKESWDESVSGNNAYSTPVLEDGLNWMPVSMTNKDAQYIESRKYQTEDIARIFRVPPHKIGHLEQSTNNNIEHQGLEFVTDSLMPWLIRWEQSVVRDLLTMEERKRYFAEFLVDGLMRGDTAARGDFYTKLFNMGAISPNEIRAKENMNPRKDGDDYYIQLNMEPNNA